MAGTISVRVEAGADLAALNTYVKLYLSANNANVKGTKRKTAPQKRSDDGITLWTEELTVPVPVEMPLDSGYSRVQVTVWNKKGIHPANECIGGTSFSFNDIVDAPRGSVYGWFKLLAEVSGRTQWSHLSNEDSPRYGMHRCNSVSSLQSVRSVSEDKVMSSGKAFGVVQMSLMYSRPKKGSKNRGTIHLRIGAARGLVAKEPYVKCYLSSNGKDIKATKQKTKVRRNKAAKTAEARKKGLEFNESFVFTISPAIQLSDANRLHVTVWDHSRLKSNECTGGFSFSIAEISNSPSEMTWFRMLPHAEGRVRNITFDLAHWDDDEYDAYSQLQWGLDVNDDTIAQTVPDLDSDGDVSSKKGGRRRFLGRKKSSGGSRTEKTGKKEKKSGKGKRGAKSTGTHSADEASDGGGPAAVPPVSAALASAEDEFGDLPPEALAALQEMSSGLIDDDLNAQPEHFAAAPLPAGTRSPVLAAPEEPSSSGQPYVGTKPGSLASMMLTSRSSPPPEVDIAAVVARETAMFKQNLQAQETDLHEAQIKQADAEALARVSAAHTESLRKVARDLERAEDAFLRQHAQIATVAAQAAAILAAAKARALDAAEPPVDAAEAEAALRALDAAEKAMAAAEVSQATAEAEIEQRAEKTRAAVEAAHESTIERATCKVDGEYSQQRLFLVAQLERRTAEIEAVADSWASELEASIEQHQTHRAAMVEEQAARLSHWVDMKHESEADVDSAKRDVEELETVLKSEADAWEGDRDARLQASRAEMDGAAAKRIAALEAEAVVQRRAQKELEKQLDEVYATHRSVATELDAARAERAAERADLDGARRQRSDAALAEATAELKKWAELHDQTEAELQLARVQLRQLNQTVTTESVEWKREHHSKLISTLVSSSDAEATHIAAIKEEARSQELGYERATNQLSEATSQHDKLTEELDALRLERRAELERIDAAAAVSARETEEMIVDAKARLAKFTQLREQSEVDLMAALGEIHPVLCAKEALTTGQDDITAPQEGDDQLAVELEEVETQIIAEQRAKEVADERVEQAAEQVQALVQLADVVASREQSEVALAELQPQLELAKAMLADDVELVALYNGMLGRPEKGVASASNEELAAVVQGALRVHSEKVVDTRQQLLALEEERAEVTASMLQAQEEKSQAATALAIQLENVHRNLDRELQSKATELNELRTTHALELANARQEVDDQKAVLQQLQRQPLDNLGGPSLPTVASAAAAAKMQGLIAERAILEADTKTELAALQLERERVVAMISQAQTSAREEIGAYVVSARAELEQSKGRLAQVQAEAALELQAKRAALAANPGSGSGSGSGSLPMATSSRTDLVHAEGNAALYLPEPLAVGELELNLDTDLDETESQLSRSDSLTSLVSIAPGNVVSKSKTSGSLQMSLRYEPTPAGSKSKIAGRIVVSIKEAANLTAVQPYVKLYVSQSGTDVKNTKRKTKVRKGASPRFKEEFEFQVQKDSELHELRRLQVTIWDHARLKANECIGGMSFSFVDIASTEQLAGWFDLLPTVKSRKMFTRVEVDPKIVRPPTKQALQKSAATNAVAMAAANNQASLSAGMGTLAGGVTDAAKWKARVSRLDREKSNLEKSLQDRTEELWDMMSKNGDNIERLAEVTAENVALRHDALDTAGIKLRIGVILKPPTGSLGLEINNDPHAKYTGVRISHVTENGPAAGGEIHIGDVLIAVNGELVLGCSFDEVIKAITDAGSVIVLSVASGKDVDSPGSPFWDASDDGFDILDIDLPDDLDSHDDHDADEPAGIDSDGDNTEEFVGSATSFNDSGLGEYVVKPPARQPASASAPVVQPRTRTRKTTGWI